MAEASKPRTAGGRERRASVLKLLGNSSLSDGEYALSAILPLVTANAIQQALCFFAADDRRDDMTGFEILVDQEAAPTMRYVDASLLPSVGGDDRFSWRVPAHWRNPPVHPLLVKATHPDGDGLSTQAVIAGLSWVDSSSHACVQVADVVAWVLRRVIAQPGVPHERALFDVIQPLLAGEDGLTFDIFSIPPLRPDQQAMHSHLQQGEQPGFWLDATTSG